MQNNVSGRNDNLNLWVVGGYTQQFSFSYENPFIDKNLKNGINIGFGYSRNRELNYGMDLVTSKRFFKATKISLLLTKHYTDFAYTYRPAIKTRHNFRASYGNIQVRRHCDKTNPHYFPTGATAFSYADISYNLTYTSTSIIILIRLKGFQADASFTSGLETTADIWQFSGRANYNLKVSRTSYLQLQAAGLFRFPFNQPYIAIAVCWFYKFVYAWA